MPVVEVDGASKTVGDGLLGADFSTRVISSSGGIGNVKPGMTRLILAIDPACPGSLIVSSRGKGGA
jgi:hypothetical protein